MIQSLTDEEMEIAARCSYRYLRKSMSKDESEKPSKEIQKKIAKSMAKRHLVAGNGNKQNALTKMKNTIQFRSEMNVDGLRLCYDEENIESGDKEYQKLREGLDNEMLTPVCQIRGYDKDFRAPINAIVNEKTDGIFHPVEYVRIHLYMIERALACQERRTGGEEDCRFVIITDCNNFSLACGPPPSISKKMIELLANHYPERLHKFFFVDTPLIFRVFWNIVKYFLDPVTAAKISFVTGEVRHIKTL